MIDRSRDRMNVKRLNKRLLVASLLGLTALPAWAHGDHGDAVPLSGGSFMTGFLHPFTG